MKKNLLFYFLFFASLSVTFAQITWNGSVSSDWNTAANWTPANIPNANNEDAIIDGAGTFQPTLPANITIRDLTMSGGSLDLGGNVLTIRASNFSGGSIQNGELRATNFTTMANMVFNGSISLVKTAGGINDLQGNNTFNGPTTITNLNNSRLRFANTNGDTFNGALIVNKNGTGNIEMAHNGSNTINSITINNTSLGGQLNFGAGGGSTTLLTGGLMTSGFVGTLVINNMTQVMNTANSTFSLAVFTASNSTFLGDFQVTTTGAITFNGNNTFAGNNTFVAGNGMTMPTGNNSFSNPGGTTNFARNAGGNSTWAGGNTFGNLNFTDNAPGFFYWNGGNTFNGDLVITNNTNSNFRMALVTGDTYNGLVTFQNNGTAFMDISYNGSNIFAQQVTINNSSPGGEVRIGEVGGTSVLQTGGLVTTGFAVCNILEINNFTQLTNSPNGNFNTITFNSANNNFLGDFSVTTSGNMTFTNANIFEGNNSFISAGQITMIAGGNTFSSPANATTIIRNGGGGITWGPGNTFGNVTLTDNSTSALTMQGGNIFNGNSLITNNSNSNLRFANTLGDTFNGPVTFQNNGTAYMDIAYRGANTFAQEVTINNSAPGGEVRFGELGGTSILQTGGLVTTDFLASNVLEINNFTQLTNAPNGTFNTVTFTSANSTFLGDFTINTTGTGIMTFTGSNRFDGTNTFNAAGQIVMSGSNFFSTVAGNNSTFIKGAASNTDNTWFGGNTFGPVHITNNSANGHLRLANTNGDNFLGTSTFINNGTDFFDIAYNGNSTFAGQITIDNNAGGPMRFGGGAAQTGTSILSSGALTTTNFNSGILNIRRFTQINPVANSTFNPDTFESQNSNFQGNFTVNATTITFLGGNSFAGDNSFISAGQMNMATGGNLFSNPGNTTTLTRNGGANVTWGPGNTFGTLFLTDNSPNNLILQGGNTFGPSVITNNNNNLLRMANTQGDNFLSTSTFINNGTNTFEIARSGINTFGDNITLNNLNAGGTMNFGINGGTSTLTNGGLLTTDYSVGNTLTINNFTQVSSDPNGDFSMNTFSASGSSLNGNIGITTLSGAITLQNGSVFAGNDTFNSASLISILNNSSFPGNDTFNAASSISITNNNFFSGINNFTSGTTLAISTNNNFEDTNNFSAGTSLSVSTGNIFGGSSTNTFGAATTILVNTNNNIGGDNIFTTGTGGITISTGNSFPDNNTFNSGAGIAITVAGGNSFSTNPGTATIMTRTGTANNDWLGGNTFGDFTLINNGTGRVRIANSSGGDNFIGDVTFVRNSSGAIEPAYNSVSTFGGNISTVGSISPLTFGIGNGTVEINGNTTQELFADISNEPLIRRLTMNTSGTLELYIPLTVSVTLTLNNGIINNNENLLTLNSGLLVLGSPSNASHVNGRIRKIGNTAFTYPFGNNGFYAPLTTSALGGAATQHFTGRYFHVNPDDVPYDRESKEPSIGIVNECEYWELENTNSSATPVLTMTWASDRTCPIDDFNEFMVTKWDGSQWIDLGQDALSGDANSGSVRNQTTVPNFSPGIFTLSQSFRILPVELLSFTAMITEDDKIKVSWSTAQEKNNAFFTLEKSLDGINWSTIGLIPGAGDSEVILFYDFIDESPVYGRQFYRLTQTDFDGTSETFRVVGVTIQSKNEKITFKVYPNPSNGLVKILSQNTNMEEAEIMVLDYQGQIVRNIKGITGRLVEMDLTDLPKGLYLLKIKHNHYWETKKVVIN
ncbi:T9SS type A sorting domain-containing protein [Aquiflexum sp. LQ15W]|uniref:T9SS type A sorting domain-containing protein n=1 Tax=Cognataquiflexum nitidum TaxID=2922272 RepID=UPI001F1455D9|nr:T9SS type A sorting domain-containing protein [Cognataquiflexum nitidum]MCH6199239.1 T9SS type A sorting domain-containing protein [Cognataquiflexum nitidum]